MAYERGGDFLEDARKILNREVRGPRQSRFSIGSAPLTSITKSDAQISGGETRQDYKDTRRFPLAAPSCALLFLPFGLPVSFRCYGRVCLIPRLTLSSCIQSSLERTAYPELSVTNPPFSPTAAPYPVTIVLSPTRKDMQKHHWQQPLVIDLEELVLKSCAG